MKRFTLFLLLFFTLFSVAGQTTGFVFANDSSFTRGYITVIHKEPMQVGIKRALYHDFIYYTARDLQEFGFLNYDNVIVGKYDSREFMVDGVIKREFLRVLVDGNLKLYRFEKNNIYFVEDQNLTQNRPSDLIQLTEENFHQILQPYAPSCQLSNERGSLIKLKKTSLTRFIEFLNRGECFVPKNASVGLLIGHNWARARIFRSSFVENVLGEYTIDNTNLKFGVFVDIPLDNKVPINLITQVSYDQFRFNHEGIRTITISQTGNPDETLDIRQQTNLDLTFIGLEILPKYSFNFNKFSTYLMSGLAFSFNMNNDEILNKQITQFGVTTDNIENNFLQLNNLHLGYTLGVGLQYYYTSHRYLALEFKNTKIYNSTIARRVLSIGNNYIALKFNF